MPVKKYGDQNGTPWYKQPAAVMALKIGGIAAKVLVTVLLILVITGIVAGVL